MLTEKEMERNAGQAPVVCQYSMIEVSPLYHAEIGREEPQLVHSLTYLFQLTSYRHWRVWTLRASLLTYDAQACDFKLLKPP